MMKMRPDKDITVRTVRISAPGGSISALVLSPLAKPQNATGVLWLHGGGYIAGMKQMVYMSRAVDLVKKYGAVVVAPGYRLAWQAPAPAAAEDCYAALCFLQQHAAALGVRSDQLMVGGESAGGGLCAAVCLMARDRGLVKVAFQMPLYPMLDDRDTDSSRDNHGQIWDTHKNHFAWKIYLRGLDRRALSPYAAPARCTDYHGLPPAYTFVGDGEPFYCETLHYIHALQQCGIDAEADVYPSNVHAFDMMRPEEPLSCTAAARFNEKFAYAQAHYFAPQP